MANTARLQIPELAASENVANGPTRINEGWNKIDNTDFGYEDFLQAGIINSTDWEFTANINSGTGALGSTANTGGTAWLLDYVLLNGALMRSVTTPATLSGLTTVAKPESGAYMSIAFAITATKWNAAATVAAYSGVQKATEAEAINAPAAVASESTRIKDVIVKNTAGVYSIVHQIDRRPWAKGAYARIIRTSGSYSIGVSAGALIDSANLALRVECTGRPIRLVLRGVASYGATPGVAGFGFRMGGSALEGTGYGLTAFSGVASGIFPVAAIYDAIPSAGSHLFQPSWENSAGTLSLTTTEATPVLFTVEELRSKSANNGTS